MLANGCDRMAMIRDGSLQCGSACRVTRELLADNLSRGYTRDSTEVMDEVGEARGVELQGVCKCSCCLLAQDYNDAITSTPQSSVPLPAQ